jgi:predicted PhzF superfamily epimerase YddE/YHI9
MRLPIYQVDAFTDTLFGGNPAAVCPLQAWLPDPTMLAIAAENNLSETAFFVREAEDYALRWFTPSVEVDLCGHATLASAHVVFSFLEPARDRVRFRTLKAGTLEVSRRSGCWSWTSRRDRHRRAKRRRACSRLWEGRRARSCAPAIISWSMAARPRSPP